MESIKTSKIMIKIMEKANLCMDKQVIRIESMLNV